MGRRSALQIPEDEVGRDSRLKLILLAVALVLVAGYAAYVTDADVLVLDKATAFLSGDVPIVPLAGGLAGVAVLALAFLVMRRRRPAKARGGGKLKTIWRGRDKADASADAMPAIADREAFQQVLAAQMESHAKLGRQFAVHVVDIDRFRGVNEMLGNAEGDAFLRLMTERLLLLTGSAERLGRIGDDEFVIVQPEAGGARHAEIYARRIQETCKDACAQVPRHARPGASIGIAVYPDHGDSADRLMRSASLALHAAKDAGGETFRVYAPDMETVIEERLSIEKAISDGLHEGWYELHFQPQYDLVTRRLTGFEALVRMNHPELGPLLPESFLPIAEASGLIQPLGEWIIREALATAQEWPRHLILSLNVSLTQLRHGDMASAILDRLAKAEMHTSRLRVEISEAVLQEPSDAVARQLQKLKANGVAIVLDDFGTSSSRLRALAELACNAVKLDRTLVEGIGEEPEAESLLRGLIGTAQSFDLAVLAEGIERAEQARFLLSNDIPNVQGFLFGRPALARELGAIIAKDMRNATDGAAEPVRSDAETSRSVA